MISILEFSANQAVIIAIALPIVALSIFILMIRLLQNGSGSKSRRYLSYLIKPPRIGTLNSETSLKRELKVRLFFVYLGIALFIVSFMIGEFYEVFMDILLPVSQSSTGETRIVTSIVFQSPFSAGWIGTFPWYGELPMPVGWGNYHETWDWIFATALFTDNPNFLGTIIIILLMISSVVGFVFLAPLAIKRIRQSFLPSVFLFITGMVTFTKAAIGCLAQAWALFFGIGQIEFGILIVTGDMLTNLVDAIVFGLPIVLAMFALFSLIGRKLWEIHYSDSRSRNWFMAFIALCYWLGLALTILMV